MHAWGDRCRCHAWHLCKRMQTKRYKWMNSGSSKCRKYSVDVLGALFGYISLSQWKLKINKRLLIRSYCLTETAHAFVEPAYPQWKEGGKHLCLVGVNHGVLTDQDNKLHLVIRSKGDLYLNHLWFDYIKKTAQQFSVFVCCNTSIFRELFLVNYEAACHPHRIHEWYIYLYIDHKNQLFM